MKNKFVILDKKIILQNSETTSIPMGISVVAMKQNDCNKSDGHLQEIPSFLVEQVKNALAVIPGQIIDNCFEI